MATPTRSQAGSTPKNPLVTTPNRLMASPRPGTAATGSRPFAYKSPAVKTPASLHSHAHHVSVSSHPSSTPLAAGAIHDELLALNSPAAALINSIGATGLTPLSSTQDGLGLPQIQGSLTRDGQAVRNPEVERLQNLQRVADILQAKVIGQGITREGVERVARLQGFEALWDEDNLTIAGNVVELDMNFDGYNKDRVRDLVLKVNSAKGESQIQTRASEILKKDLGIGEPSSVSKSPTNLQAFATNLRYLEQLDHADPNIDCFEIIGGLSKAFKIIWEEEKKRMKWRNEIFHVCGGNLGRPTMDRKPKLGLCIDYWQSRHRSVQTDDEVETNESDSRWSGRFSCEAGDPSITPAQQWISDEVLQKGGQAENVLDADEEEWTPAWQDPLQQSSIDSNKAKMDEEAMDVDQADGGIPQPINIRLVFSLEPEVLIPISTAMGLNSEINMIDINQAKAITYQQALQNLRNREMKAIDSTRFESRWLRTSEYFNQSGKMSTYKHSYALYPSPVGTELWFYPISKLKFNHPQQLATVIPILRQYAILWDLFSSLVTHSDSSITTSKLQSVTTSLKTPGEKRVVKKRSNAKPATTRPGDIESSGDVTESASPVDISLDVISNPSKPRMDLIIPIENINIRNSRSHFLHLSIVVELGGKLNIVQVDGLSEADSARLTSKLSQVLVLTEDIGMALQWLTESLKS